MHICCSFRSSGAVHGSLPDLTASPCLQDPTILRCLVLCLPQAIRLPRVGLPQPDRPSYRRQLLYLSFQLTVLRPACIDLPIRTVRSTKNRSMMPLVHLLLLTGVEVVHPDPGVIGGSNDEAVAEEGVKGSRCRRVGKGNGDRWMLAESTVSLAGDRCHTPEYLPKDIEEMDVGSGGNAQRPTTMRQLHRRYRLAEVQGGGLLQGTEVPPSRLRQLKNP